jgi:CheY-like chemotaxis protein
MMGRMLVVDDEPLTLEFLHRVFRHDYEVVSAVSVEEALPLLDGPAFDVIIADRIMPRRSGLALLEVAAKRMPSALRITLTGYADSQSDETEAQWRLVDAWVSKPIDGAALMKALADARDKHGH